MFESIDSRSPTPLYEQIGRCIRVAVAAGELRAGEALPSVRQLAGTLRVNPATVSQAYRELARQGFVAMRHGAGTFVKAVDPDVRERARTRHAREIARRALGEAARAGVTAGELAEALRAESADSGGPPARPHTTGIEDADDPMPEATP